MQHPETSSRLWRLIANPVGNDFASAYRLETGPLPAPTDGEVLIRNEYLSLDAGTRMWVTTRTDAYQPPLPLGTPMPGLIVGRVLESRAAGFAAGDLVRGFGRWGDHSCVVPALAALMKVDDTVADPRQHLGVLGMTGWTAYHGVVETGRARPGETVLVSAAAGATGLTAAQIARNMGCRVVGLAGGEKKCRLLTETFGLDRAIDYKAVDVDRALAEEPRGVHVYFDNVGGPLLDAVLPNMAHYGRIAVCGLVAQYADTGPAQGPRRFDQVLMRRLTISGFFSPDFVARGPEYNALLRPWLDTGRITLPFDQTDGLEHVLKAYTKLFTGANVGKVIVRIA
jgi:NADPH-dependent curcumin reductase CurA